MDGSTNSRHEIILGGDYKRLVANRAVSFPNDAPSMNLLSAKSKFYN